MYVYVYEHVWVLIFWLYCISCTYRKRKKNSHKKRNIRKSQDFIELLPSARPPPEIKILTVTRTWKKSPEKKILKFPRSALIHIKTRVCLKYLVNDCGFFTGCGSFQYGLRNSATYIPYIPAVRVLKCNKRSKKTAFFLKATRLQLFD